jgi:hypothetical protein
MNIDELVGYSDSLHGINLIKGPPIKFHGHVALIQDIKDLIEQNNITISHTLRERNQCADFMAKLGTLSNVDLLIHPSHTDDIIVFSRSTQQELFSLWISSWFFLFSSFSFCCFD